MACLDMSVSLGFCPFGEVISGDKQKLSLSKGWRQGLDYVDPPHKKGLRTRHGVELVVQDMDDIRELLTDVAGFNKEL